MLDFIVLGLIPGTHLRLTFYWVIFVGVLALAFASHPWHEEE